MSGISDFVRSWFSRDDGATAVEYGLIAAGIALAISAAVYSVGGNIVGMFDSLTNILGSSP